MMSTSYPFGTHHVLFKNRLHAGTLLIDQIRARTLAPDLILGLSHGGAVPAVVIGKAVHTPVRALIVRKISSPNNPEYALGAEVLENNANKKLDLKNKNICIVDDGAATGKTMEAAVRWVRKKKAKRITVALPVASSDASVRLRPIVDELIVYHEDTHLTAVGAYYNDFRQVTDEDMIKLLQ